MRASTTPTPLRHGPRSLSAFYCSDIHHLLSPSAHNECRLLRFADEPGRDTQRQFADRLNMKAFCLRGLPVFSSSMRCSVTLNLLLIGTCLRRWPLFLMLSYLQKRDSFMFGPPISRSLAHVSQGETLIEHAFFRFSYRCFVSPWLQTFSYPVSVVTFVSAWGRACACLVQNV